MPNSVLAQIVRRNSYDYECQTRESILCENAAAEGIFWRIPTSRGGVLTGYSYRKSATKPTPDSIKTIRVNDKKNGVIYYVAIADNADETLFVDACNECCGDTPALPLVAMPVILIEEEGCPNEEGDYTYFAVVDTPPPAGGVYKLSGSVNNTALPAAPAEGFATLADLKTWADANWSTGDLDGVTLDGGKVILNAGPTGLTGSIVVEIEQYFESNAPGALTSGQNYSLAATINGNVLPVLASPDDAPLADLATLANNTASHSVWGTWSVVAGKLRLVSTTVELTGATLVVTKV